jgi:hypothetical protein
MADSLDLEHLGVGDLDVAVRMAGDYARVTQKDDWWAYGTDGTFAADAPWVLRSAAVDFAAHGIPAGATVVIQRPRDKPNPAGVAASATPGGVDELLLIDSTASHAATLRRKGRNAGAGRPPGTPGAAITGITFSVPTADLQIRQAAAEVANRFGIAAVGQIRQPYDFVPAVLARTLVLLYRAAAMQATEQANKDDWWAKAGKWEKEYDAAIARLAMGYAPANSAGAGVAVGPLGGVSGGIASPWPYRRTWPI